MPILNRTKISARRQSPARHSDYAVACRAEEATDFAGYVGVEQRIERSVIAQPAADAQVVQIGSSAPG